MEEKRGKTIWPVTGLNYAPFNLVARKIKVKISVTYISPFLIYQMGKKHCLTGLNIGRIWRNGLPAPGSTLMENWAAVSRAESMFVLVTLQINILCFSSLRKTIM